MRKKKQKKRGPKGGIKHQPGRGHDRKSKPQKVERFKRAAKRKEQEHLEGLRRAWQTWDGLSDDAKKILFDLEPSGPRPTDED